MKPPRHFKGRYGYTTGACATAALKGALLILFGQIQPRIKIKLPVGWEAEFELKSFASNGKEAWASVIKDAGDDPDVTNGAEIKVKVKLIPGTGKIRFQAGEGVGIVTKPGLGIPIGEPAISAVPRRMMERVIAEILGKNKKLWDFIVTISIPEGERLAQNTLNARLGIKGGLSILGTKGIVIPFSTAAYKASIVKAFHVARALGIQEVILTTGGRSEAFCQKIFKDLPEEAFVQVGDFVGFSLRSARRNGFRRITLAMMLAKMAKIAAGLPNTHAKYGNVPLEKLLLWVQQISNLPKDFFTKKEILTARHLLEILKEKTPHLLQPFAERVCSEAASKALEMAKGSVNIRAILLDFDGELLACVEK